MSQPPDSIPPEPEDSAWDELRGDGLDDLVRARLTPRAQLLRALLLVALVAVVTGGLFWRSAGFAAPPSPTPGPIPTFPPGPPGVRILSNAGFGNVMVNGIWVGNLPALAVLRPGANTITLTTPPFRSHTCTISWPFGESNDLACIVNPLSEPQNVVARGQHISLGGELDIEVVGADLTTTQCARVAGLVERALDTNTLTTLAPAGAHVATGRASSEGIPISRVVSSAAQARLQTQAQVFGGRPCTSLLYGGVAQPYYAVTNPARPWSINVPVLEQLTVVQTDGKILGQTPTMEGSIGVIIDAPENGDGEWRLVMTDPPLSSQLTGNLCAGGAQALSNVFNLTHPGASWGVGPSSDSGLNGCQLELDTYDGNAEVVTHYLWRFGVLLAQDQAAHNVLPQLPVASPGERAIFSSGA